MKRAVLVLCALGVLCGCSGSAEEQPKALPPVSATGPAGTPAPSASPTTQDPTPSPFVLTSAPTPPPSSLTVSEEDGRAAEATNFAKRWLAAVNDANFHVDPSGVARLSDSTCLGCQNTIASLRAAAAKGEHYRGGEFHVRNAVAPALEQGETVAQVDVSVTELEVLDRSGAVVERQPAVPKLTVNITVRAQADGTLRVYEVTRS